MPLGDLRSNDADGNENVKTTIGFISKFTFEATFSLPWRRWILKSLFSFTNTARYNLSDGNKPFISTISQ